MRKFLLSECFRENVRKDAEFEALGILDSRVKLPFLTFIENESYIDKLFHNPHISAVITNVAIYENYLKDIDCGCHGQAKLGENFLGRSLDLFVGTDIQICTFHKKHLRFHSIQIVS